jgi:hypothetical protein
MDIRKISMYLAWKLPPYYGSSNVYAFTKALRRFAKEEYTNEEISFIQTQAKWVDEEVYFLVLDDLWNSLWEEKIEWKKSRKDVIELLQWLWVKNEVLGFEEEKNLEYTWKKFDELLEKRFWSKLTTNNKWDLFEELCFDILSIEWWFTNVKKASAWADWWIDVTADYRLPIWGNTDISLWFFWQAKYKSSWNVQAAEVNILTLTINNDTAQKYQWVFYFTNREYAPKAREALENISKATSNRKCFWLDWNDILKIVSWNKDLYKKYTV